MDPRLAPLAGILALNTRLFHNCLAEVDDALALRRVTPGCNSLAFLAAHLADSRHYACKVAGRELANPLSSVLDRGKTQDEIGPLPPLADIIAAWDAVSTHLATVLERLDAEALAGKGPRFPGTDGTLLSGLAFLAQHDSYHVGQMAIVRRQLGLAAMKY